MTTKQIGYKAKLSGTHPAIHNHVSLGELRYMDS